MKILSNKKYNELILKSCRGMFGAVTDDMLLRNNALLDEENKQLKDKIPYIIQNNSCKYISIEKCKNKVCVNYKMQELQESDSNE